MKTLFRKEICFETLCPYYVRAPVWVRAAKGGQEGLRRRRHLGPTRGSDTDYTQIPWTNAMGRVRVAILDRLILLRLRLVHEDCNKPAAVYIRLSHIRKNGPAPLGPLTRLEDFCKSDYGPSILVFETK